MISVRPLLGALLGLVFVADTHAKPAAAKEDEGVIEPQADAVLHRMSDYLAGLQAFRMETTSVDEKVTTEHQKIQELKESKVSVKRPGRLRVDRAGPKGHAVFRDDGQRFTLFHVEKNVFTDAPAPPTIDAAVDNVRQRLGVDAPAGDLIVSDAYNALTDGVKVARYVGLEPIGNVQAHHLAMRKKDVDYQLWIQDGPQAVPLRYVIVSKDMPSQPEYTLEITRRRATSARSAPATSRAWDVNPSIADDEFKLEVPPNAKRVDLTMKQQEKKP